jgi:HEAT repeat protein
MSRCRVEPIDDLLKKLASADEEERRLAVSALSGFPFHEVKSLAVAALGDESWRVRKEAVDLILSVSPGEDLARELITLLTVQGNAGLKNSVVEVLQMVGEKILPQLVEHLSHEDAGVRKFIVDIMGGIGSAASIPELTTALADSDANVAAAAAESLGMIGDAVALPALLKTLERDDLLIRYAILEALVKIGTPVPLGVITPLAGDPLLKKALFECLGVIGDLASAPLLVDGLSDRARNVREAALTALALLRSRTVADQFRSSAGKRLQALAGTETVEYLTAMRESPDTKIRISAITILGLVGDPRAVDAFITGYRDESLQQSVLAAMRDMGEMIGPLLYSRCLSADEEERCIITHIAGELNLAESRKIAAAGMDDPSAAVRALAAEAVGKSGMTELIPAVVKLLTDMNAEVRRRATGALVRLANVARESVASSAQLLAEAESADCRLQAVKLFGALRDVAHLNFLGKDEDAQVRREAITTLGDIRLPESADRIAMALTDEEVDVRVAAATALGWSGFADETHSLHLALLDQSPRVQVAAMKSLGRRQDVAAFTTVAAFVESASGMLQIAAMQAIVQIDPVRAALLLQRAKTDHDEEVARVAANLLDALEERF